MSRFNRPSKQLDQQAKLQSLLFEPATNNESKFRHSHWEARRSKIIEAKRRIKPDSIGLQHFCECGGSCIVEYSATKQKYRLSANYCHDRHCEPCARAKANKIAANLEKRLLDKTSLKYRFVTLTLRHSKTPLRAQIDRLYNCFKKLRAGKFWKSAVAGGCFVLEVKLNKNGEWHPHLHVIAEANWIAQDGLKAEWKRVTEDSFLVDVRLIGKAKDAAHYVVKYVTKSVNPSVWDDADKASEWIIASKGVRTCATFGSWRGLKLTKSDDAPKDWKRICRLDELIRRAIAGERAATDLLVHLKPRVSFGDEVRREGS